MVETTRRKAVVSIGGLMFIGGCSDALDSDDDGDESEANGTDGLDESDADDENGASGDEVDSDESDADDSETDEESEEDIDDEVTEEEDEDETAEGDDDDEADDQLSTEEFVTQLETAYSGEVAEYDENDTHGILTLVAKEDISTHQLASDMEGILDIYSSYMESGNAPSQHLEGEVENTDGGQEVSDFTVETEWVEAYNRGEMSEEELKDRVLETVET